MLIAKIKNGNPSEIVDVRQVFACHDDPTIDFLKANEYLPVKLEPEHNPATQKIVACPPYVADDTVFLHRVESMSESEVEVATEVAAARVRSRRALLLVDSDWTQIADAPVDKAAWAKYRQALRDITSQEGFPWAVEWPHSPNWVGPAVT